MNFNLENHRMNHLVDSRYPIYGLSHNPDVVAAISNAGGVGVWAAARLLPDEIREGSEKLRAEIGPLPFGINLMLPKNVPRFAERQQLEAELPSDHRDFIARIHRDYGVPDDGLIGPRNRIVRSAELFDAQIEAAIDSSADLFAMAIGTRRDAVDSARARGMKIVALIGAPKHMSEALGLNPDLIVAQGYDAGGHTGSVGTYSLIPRIVEMSDGVPVLAAGGIGTGQQIVASLAMGAAGAWLGTLWLASTEESLHPALLAKVLAAGVEDTVVTRCSSGKPMRQIRTAWSDAWGAEGAPLPLPMPWQDMLVGSLEGSIARHEVEDLMYTPAGQSIEWARDVTTVNEIVQRLVSESEASMQELFHSMKVTI